MRLSNLLVALVVVVATVVSPALQSCAPRAATAPALAVAGACPCCGTGPCHCGPHGCCMKARPAPAERSLILPPNTTDATTLVGLAPALGYGLTPTARPALALSAPETGVVTQQHASCLGTRAPPLA